MEKATLQNLKIAAESIAKVYMDVLKNGNTPENQKNLQFLFAYENDLYQTLSFDDCEEYSKELKKQQKMLSRISIIEVCLGHFCFDANARILERLAYLKDYKAAVSEEIVQEGSIYRFRYAHYTKFFLYLITVYKQRMKERPYYKGLILSYLNVLFTYNYAEIPSKKLDFTYDEETLQKFVGASDEENDLCFKGIAMECLEDLKNETLIFETNNNDYLAKDIFKIFLEANFLCLKNEEAQEEILEKVHNYILDVFKNRKATNKDKVAYFQELEILFDVRLSMNAQR